jgi:hypothetical protein
MEILMTQVTCNAPEISKRKAIARRQFLHFLAGSPLLTATSAGTITRMSARARAMQQHRTPQRRSANVQQEKWTNVRDWSQTSNRIVKIYIRIIPPSSGHRYDQVSISETATSDKKR